MVSYPWTYLSLNKQFSVFNSLRILFFHVGNFPSNYPKLSPSDLLYPSKGMHQSSMAMQEEEQGCRLPEAKRRCFEQYVDHGSNILHEILRTGNETTRMSVRESNTNHSAASPKEQQDPNSWSISSNHVKFPVVWTNSRDNVSVFQSQGVRQLQATAVKPWSETLIKHPDGPADPKHNVQSERELGIMGRTVTPSICGYDDNLNRMDRESECFRTNSVLFYKLGDRQGLIRLYWSYSSSI